MSNNLRTRNGLPFSFPDGIKVRGVDIEDYFNSLDPGTVVGPLAPLQSPNLTGTPTAPTPVAGTNTTQLATTEFVNFAIDSLVAVGEATTEVAGKVILATSSESTAGENSHKVITPATLKSVTDTLAPADHVHSDYSLTAHTHSNYSLSDHVHTNYAANDHTHSNYSLLDSPTFTGTPTAPTPVAGTNTTQLATTEFVTAALTNAEINGIATDIGITTNSSTIALTSSTGKGTTIPAATDTSAGAMSSADKVALSGKQDKLVSGTNIKTINGESVLGNGDIAITVPSVPTIQHGVGVADGDAFASVVFNNPFSVRPTVVCSPTLGGANRVYSCEVIESSITNDGFRTAFTYIDLVDHTQKAATLGDSFLWIAVGS